MKNTLTSAKAFSLVAERFGYNFAAKIAANENIVKFVNSAEFRVFHIYSDPDGRYHISNPYPANEEVNYVGTRYEWVATCSSYEEAEEYLA